MRRRSLWVIPTLLSVLALASFGQAQEREPETIPCPDHKDCHCQATFVGFDSMNTGCVVVRVSFTEGECGRCYGDSCDEPLSPCGANVQVELTPTSSSPPAGCMCYAPSYDLEVIEGNSRFSVESGEFDVEEPSTQESRRLTPKCGTSVRWRGSITMECPSNIPGAFPTYIDLGSWSAELQCGDCPEHPWKPAGTGSE